MGTHYPKISSVLNKILQLDTVNSLESDMPPETRALLDGLYQLVGTQVLRDDHQTGQQAGNVILRGTYLGQTVYLVEEFQHISPSPSRHKGVEPQEAFMAWVVGEAQALEILHS